MSSNKCSNDGSSLPANFFPTFNPNPNPIPVFNPNPNPIQFEKFEGESDESEIEVLFDADSESDEGEIEVLFNPNEYTIEEQLEKAYEALFNPPLFDELKEKKLKFLLNYVLNNIELYINTPYLKGIPATSGETEEEKQTKKFKMILLLKYISLYIRKINLKMIDYLSILGLNQKLINILNNNGVLSAEDWLEIWYLREKYLIKVLKNIINNNIKNNFMLIYNTIFKIFVKYMNYNRVIFNKNKCLAELLFNAKFIPENITAIYYQIEIFINSNLFENIKKFLFKADSAYDTDIFKMRVSDFYLANFHQNEVEDKLELIEKAKTKKDLLKVLFDFSVINGKLYKLLLIKNTMKTEFKKQISIKNAFNPCPMSLKRLNEKIDNSIEILNKLLNYNN